MDVIRISIGTEPMQYIASEVLKSSILRRTNQPVEFSASWEPMQGWHPAMKELPRLPRGTKFNVWRWCVPGVYANRGQAIYLDADQVVLDDIAKLWDALLPGNSFAAVCNAQGIFGKKKPEPGAVQTSVMVMDCDLCRWDIGELARRVNRGEMEYRDLMQARFLHRADIQELPPEWNHFGIHTPATKLLHWSHVASQPYRKAKHPTANIFRQELHAAIRAGHVTRAAVYEAIGNGHLCTEWGNNLPHPDPPEFLPPAELPEDAVLISGAGKTPASPQMPPAIQESR